MIFLYYWSSVLTERTLPKLNNFYLGRPTLSLGVCKYTIIILLLEQLKIRVICLIILLIALISQFSFKCIISVLILNIFVRGMSIL